jgi:hypothetical protein
VDIGALQKVRNSTQAQLCNVTHSMKHKTTAVGNLKYDSGNCGHFAGKKSDHFMPMASNRRIPAKNKKP